MMISETRSIDRFSLTSTEPLEVQFISDAMNGGFDSHDGNGYSVSELNRFENDFNEIFKRARSYRMKLNQLADETIQGGSYEPSLRGGSYEPSLRRDSYEPPFQANYYENDWNHSLYGGAKGGYIALAGPLVRELSKKRDALGLQQKQVITLVKFVIAEAKKQLGIKDKADYNDPKLKDRAMKITGDMDTLKRLVKENLK